MPGTPILRIGNIKDEAANLKASFAKGVTLTSNIDTQHNPETRRPVWNTDSTFRQNSPIGSVFHCRQATPEGAETLFADNRQAYAGL
ncbi:MAG: TauD/TfdA family dioxygenase, partial [Pseudomonadota bacterium]|nr:TauD/TfdA family dioxygenase [Pseudomonadota bacterium]